MIERQKLIEKAKNMEYAMTDDMTDDMKLKIEKAKSLNQEIIEKKMIQEMDGNIKIYDIKYNKTNYYPNNIAFVIYSEKISFKLFVKGKNDNEIDDMIRNISRRYAKSMEDKIHLKIQNNKIFYVGDTFVNKDIIKAKGCRWDIKEKIWYFNDDINNIINKYINNNIIELTKADSRRYLDEYSYMVYDSYEHYYI